MKTGLKKALVEIVENNGKPFGKVDTHFIKFTRQQENPLLRGLMGLMSNTGEPWTLYPVSGVVVARWLSRERNADAATLGVALAGSAILNKVLKGIVQRPRPRFRIHLSKSSGSSFPAAT